MNRITKYILPVLLAGMLMASCKKAYFYHGINEDPSQLKTPTPASLLAGTILSSGYLWGGDASRYASIFTQQTYGNANQAYSYSHYIVTSDDVDNLWYAGTYGAVMTNIDTLIKVAHAQGQGHYEAVGKILMANMLGLTTDFWGDAPYSQAFQGINNTQPKFDTQEQIYTSLQSMLDDAITLLSTDDGSEFQPGGEDLLYGGDLDKWLRFAHSLKAKFYLHLIKVAGHTDPTEGIAQAGLGFKSGESATVAFAGSAAVTTQAPWYQFNTQRGDISFDGHLYDMMVGDNDPRFAPYFDTANATLGPLYGNPNSGVVLMSYDELQFDLAELRFRKGQTTDAAIAYNTAVKANLIRSGVEETDADTYAASVGETAASITLQDIINQKYRALYLSPETWTDWRRTGFPTLSPADGNVLGAIPRSLLYPSSEVRYNAGNTPKRTTMLARVWWDVQ